MKDIAVFAPQSSRTGQDRLASRGKTDAVCSAAKGYDVGDSGLMLESFYVRSRRGTDLSRIAALVMSECSNTKGANSDL